MVPVHLQCGQDGEKGVFSPSFWYFLEEKKNEIAFSMLFMLGYYLFGSKLGIIWAITLFPHSHLHPQHNTVK